MEVDNFTIYVDRLADGAVEAFDFEVPADFLEVNEPDLSYLSPVKIQGEAYTAEAELVLCIDMSVTAQRPCTLCSDPVKVPIEINHAYFAEPLETMKSGLFNFKELVRETILLETPSFVKCGGQECKRKAELTKYLKSDDIKAKGNEGDEYLPFADLDFKE